MSRSRGRKPPDPFEGVTGKDRERLDALLAWRDQTPVIGQEPEATRRVRGESEVQADLPPPPRGSSARKRGRRFKAAEK